MYESLLNFPGHFLDDFERVRRSLESVTGFPQSIRSVAAGAFPAMNVGSTATSIEIYAFAPGIDPAKVEVVLDQGVLTISGERPSELPTGDTKVSVYGEERFSGRFKRAVSLPEDADPDRISASYRDGVLHVSIGRRESALPKRVRVE